MKLMNLIRSSKKNPPPPFIDATTDVNVLRDKERAMIAACQRSTWNQPATDEKDYQVQTRDGSSITVRVYRKPNQTQAGPMMTMLHGGGWVLGDLENEAMFCRQWCEIANGVAVNVGYRLAPEHKFPIPVNDSYDALEWAVANASLLGADPSKGLILGGVSAGANMAAVISHLWRDDHHHIPLTGLYLSVPPVLYPEAVPEKYKSQYLSQKENENGLFLNKKAATFFHDHYAADPLSPLFSPFIFPSGHHNLPPTYFQVCGLDQLQDDGFLYEKVLREEYGIETRLDFYPGLPHYFWAWWPESDFTKKHWKDSIAGLTWLLEKSQRDA
ncbi:hypothetical protein B7463_g10655, partial [Scytalidium lignicola]